MRMKELVQETGIPRTAIHHYQREGLLPPANKTAPNAALYGSEHVRRLKVIRALRGDELGPMSMDGVRQVLEMVERGIEVEVAAALYSVPGALGKSASGSTRSAEQSLSEVAHEAGLSLSTARALHGAGLLLGRAGAGGTRIFDEADARAARLIADLLSDEGVQPADFDPVAELMGELVRYEKALASLATAKLSPTEGAARRRAMYHSLHALHTYLFRRLVPKPGDS
jgi:DNA-binding transcriptional MerR regulator